jgi:hypothetical protein
LGDDRSVDLRQLVTLLARSAQRGSPTRRMPVTFRITVDRIENANEIGGVRHVDHVVILVEQRAAIPEYEAGLSRAEAERLARAEKEATAL